MKNLLLLFISLIFTNCNGTSGSNSQETSLAEQETSSSKYKTHKNITVTYFWVGEAASSENGFISNLASAWDENWTSHYGGEDTPNSRTNYYPSAFTPKQNSFYFALPYNDLDENGDKKPQRDTLIPWATPSDTNDTICKDRWIKITKGSSVAYAQWEDVGPFGEEDSDYVFGSAQPQSSINSHAGLDVYLLYGIISHFQILTLSLGHL